MCFYCDHSIYQCILRIWLRTFQLSVSSMWKLTEDSSNACTDGDPTVTPREHTFSKSQRGLLGKSGDEEVRAEHTLMLWLFKLTPEGRSNYPGIFKTHFYVKKHISSRKKMALNLKLNDDFWPSARFKSLQWSALCFTNSYFLKPSGLFGMISPCLVLSPPCF